MRKLLLVVDMQNDFIDGSLGTPEAVAIVPKVIEKIKTWDGDVLCTQDTHSETYMETQEGKNLPFAHCLKDMAGWQLQPDIAALCLEKGWSIIEKPGFGAKDLPEFLKTNYPQGLSEIHLIGLCTDICVIVNALLLKTFFPEIPIYVDGSCCAGVTPESHENALSAMRVCHINIV